MVYCVYYVSLVNARGYPMVTVLVLIVVLGASALMALYNVKPSVY